MSITCGLVRIREAGYECMKHARIDLGRKAQAGCLAGDRQRKVRARLEVGLHVGLRAYRVQATWGRRRM